MEVVLERGMSIDEGVRAADELQMNAVSLKQTAKRTNNAMCMRKYGIYIGGTVCVLILITVVCIIIFN